MIRFFIGIFIFFLTAQASSQNVKLIRKGEIKEHDINSAITAIFGSKLDTAVLVIMDDGNAITWTLGGKSVKQGAVLNARVFYIFVAGNRIMDEPSVNYIKNKSAIENSVNDILSFIKQSNRFGIYSAKSNGGNIPYKVYEVSNIKPPGNAEIIIDVIQDDNSRMSKKITVPIHELNWALLKVGVQQSKFVKNDFRISEGRIIASPDSAHRKEWKQQLFVAIEVHWPRDPETYNPNIYNWKKHNYDRLGLFTGLKLSKAPLDVFFIGSTVDLFKDFSFVGGLSWKKIYKNESVAIGNVSSLKTAKNYLTQKYSKPTWFWGLALSPSAMAESLGLKEKQ